MAVNAKLKNRFGKVGVLMGGPSSEREISLKSGYAVFESLNKSGIDVCAIDIKTDNRPENIELIKSHVLDCAFIALHGRFGEDGQIQEILDSINIVYTGSPASASRLAMDKAATHKVFEAGGVLAPRYKVLSRGNNENIDFDFPLVVKPVSNGSSVGLSIVDKKEDMPAAIKIAFSFDEKILVEEYIAGREVTVGILADKPLAVIEIIPKRRFFDYQAKYQKGMTEYVVPAKIENKIAVSLQEKALLAHRLLGCQGCSRVDMILNKDNVAFVLEANTIPGMTETSLLPKAAAVEKIDFSGLCLKLLELAYEKKKS